MLTSSVSVEAGDTLNCTALYFVGVGGDFIVFSYLLERMSTLYHPAPTVAHTKPFIHALLENAAKDFSKFSQYYQILEIVVDKYPDEINQVWKGNTITDCLNKLHVSVKNCLGPALRSKEVKMQSALESQIFREIMNNEVIILLLSGAQKVKDVCFYQDRPKGPPIDVTVVLRDNIKILDSLIDPYFGTGWLRVSESFYNDKFFPWRRKCDSDAVCNNYLPASEVRNSVQAIKEINIVINLIHGHFTRSLQTPSLKCSISSDLICHRDAIANLAEEKKNESLFSFDQKKSISPPEYTLDTVHPASFSFLKMFKNRGEFKEEKIDEEVIGATVHPAWR